MSSATAQATFAFGAGITTFFSPCVYALLPGYVSYYVTAVEGEKTPLVGAAARGVAASLGAIVTFAGLSMLAMVASETVEQLIPVIEPLVGISLVVFGLLVFWKGALSLTVPLPARRTSVIGFVLFGGVYAIAATACVLPLFLSVAVTSVGLSPAGTLLVLGAYTTGFALLMLSVTVATAVGHDAIVGRMRSHTGPLMRVAAIVIVLAGIGQLYVAWAVPTA